MEISEMLDTLAEYQAQKDLLDMDKQALIDAVKIPAEVQAIHDEGEKRQCEIRALYSQAVTDFDELQRAELSEVVVPPEIKAAYDAIEAKRNAIIAETNQRKSQAWMIAQNRENEIADEFNSKVSKVYDQVAMRKSEIIAEFGDKASAVVDNIAKLTAEIKDAVKTEGKTVRGKVYMAVWVKGRDGGWDTKQLQGYALAHPEILTAKNKDGEPSITIRKI